MSMKNAKNILYSQMGVTPLDMQYGGGLDDAYRTLSDRRRRSAFADPDATSAFANGGLPTIYRQEGGEFAAAADYVMDDEGNVSEFSEDMIDRVDDGLGQGDLPGDFDPDAFIDIAPAPTAPAKGESRTSTMGSDTDAGGWGWDWFTSTGGRPPPDEDPPKDGLLGLVRTELSKPSVPQAFLKDGKIGSFQPPDVSVWDSLKNLVTGKASPSPKFVEGLNYKEYDKAKEEAKEEWDRTQRDPDKFESWFDQNFIHAMGGVREGKNPVAHTYEIQSEAAGDRFNTLLGDAKKDPANKGKSEEEVARDVAKSMFKNYGYNPKDTGKINYPIWAPLGTAVNFLDAMNKSIGSVMIGGMKFSVNKDGTVTPLDAPEEPDTDLGPSDEEPVETPETEMASGIQALEKQLGKKGFESLMRNIGKKKKGREKLPYHPDAPLLARLYGITLEEADEWLGERTSGEEEISVGIEEQLT